MPTLTAPITAQALFASSVAKAAKEEGGGGGDGRLRVLGRLKNEVDDYVLGGGLDCPAVVGVSAVGEGGEVGRMVAISTMITLLVESKEKKVMIVDCLGTFPLQTLERCLNHRITQSRAKVGDRETEVEAGDERRPVDEEVEECLARVGISRVFSVEGLWEVLREVDNSVCEDAFRLDENPAEHYPDELRNESTTEDQLSQAISNHQQATKGEEMAAHDQEQEKSPIIEIQDSEEEDSDLDIASSPPPMPAAAPASQDSEAAEQQGTSNSSKTELVIVDNMTTLINELFSRIERTAAHQTLTALTRTLLTLSKTRNLTIILLNTTITPNSASRTSSKSNSNPGPQTSVFSSTITRPSLGRIFDDIVQLHILITHVPRTASDAALLHSLLNPSNSSDDENSEPNPRHNKAATTQKDQNESTTINYTHVFEIVKDTTPFSIATFKGNGNDPEETWNTLQSVLASKAIQRREQKWCAIDFIYAPPPTSTTTSHSTTTATTTTTINTHNNNLDNGSGSGNIKGSRNEGREVTIVGIQDSFKSISDGSMRGLGLIREKRFGKVDVGAVPRLYGFGGRRG